MIPDGITVVSVQDTLAALGAIAAYHRKQFSLPTIAVTGSNGKTTTKEMIAHILSGKGPVLKNEGTKNNRIGVPLTLLQLTPEHRFAVLELGMSEVGEIGTLSRMVAPTAGGITNIGPAHLGFLGDLETVFSCKMELAEGLRKGGVLVLNGEDLYLKKVTSSYHRIIFFGKGSAFEATEIRSRKERLFFRFNRRLEGFIPLLGEHQVDNALAAIAVASCHGVTPSFSIERLKHFKGLPGRMSFKRIHGTDVIDDSYNANPESTRRALESFKKYPAKGKRIFILGDMLELGEESPSFHATVGEKVAASGIDIFLTVGESSRWAHERAGALGMNGDRMAHCTTPAEAARVLMEKVKRGDAVLVKGSRGMGMEEVIRIFEGQGV